MNFTRAVLAVTLPCVMLAACGDGAGLPGSSVDTELKDGTVMSYATTSKGLTAPADMPSFAPIYPGGVIDNVNTNKDKPGRGVLGFRAKASVEEVVQFYRQNAEKSGLKLMDDQGGAGGQMLTFVKPDGPSEGHGVQVTIVPDMANAGGVVVAMMYAGPA